jgi:hypothetical protein
MNYLNLINAKKMKNILSAIGFLVLMIMIFYSCHKEDAVNDYLPLKVGVKYKYKYSDAYSYWNESSHKRGECTWNFISKSAGTPVVYQVEQSFTGYSTYPGLKDSFYRENEKSNLSFEILKDGKVAFAFSVPYWGSTKKTFERFIESDKNDTCFYLSNGGRGCLRKNVGITYFTFGIIANHCSTVSYSLIEGPTY